MSRQKILALLAAFGATLIYGLNHTIAKVIMPEYIGAYGFIMLRLLGAGLLFWAISPYFPKERIQYEDYGRLFFAALLGMCINMLMFFKGLELSTPINSGVIITITPIMVLVLSYLFLKEPIGWRKTIGIFLGFTGALGLTLFGVESQQNAPNIPLGNALFLINSSSYAAYLILVKPLTQKYHTITLMKWSFLIGLLLSSPVTFTEFMAVEWNALPMDVIWRMAFVVVGTSFLTYLFNVYSLKTLSPTTVGAFIYFQPLIAILYAVLSENDQLDVLKITATFLILIGVYLVTKKRNRLH